MAVTFVTQYDVEMYQKIEVHLGGSLSSFLSLYLYLYLFSHLYNVFVLGKKLTEYPCVESDVMLLVERATQAMGSAKVELREMDQKRRKR